MPYSILEAIAEGEKTLASERVIAKEYPDAVLETLPNGKRVWMSENARVTDVHAVADGKDVRLFGYCLVDGTRVYAAKWQSTDGDVVLSRLKLSDPPAYVAVVKATIRG